MNITPPKNRIVGRIQPCRGCGKFPYVYEMSSLEMRYRQNPDTGELEQLLDESCGCVDEAGIVCCNCGNEIVTKKDADDPKIETIVNLWNTCYGLTSINRPLAERIQELADLPSFDPNTDRVYDIIKLCYQSKDSNQNFEICADPKLILSRNLVPDTLIWYENVIDGITVITARDYYEPSPNPGECYGDWGIAERGTDQ